LQKRDTKPARRVTRRGSLIAIGTLLPMVIGRPWLMQGRDGADFTDSYDAAQAARRLASTHPLKEESKDKQNYHYGSHPDMRGGPLEGNQSALIAESHEKQVKKLTNPRCDLRLLFSFGLEHQMQCHLNKPRTAY
jgi:hypothetical protein